MSCSSGRHIACATVSVLGSSSLVDVVVTTRILRLVRGFSGIGGGARGGTAATVLGGGGLGGGGLGGDSFLHAGLKLATTTNAMTRIFKS